MEVFQGELSDRELVVLMMMAEGNCLEEIGTELELAVVTIKHTLSEIRSKLGAKNNCNAIALAYHKGILRVKEN